MCLPANNSDPPFQTRWFSAISIWIWPSWSAYAHELSKVEWFIEQQAKQHNPVHLNLSKNHLWYWSYTIALTIIYEDRDLSIVLKQCRTLHHMLSLVKCKAESAGKSYGTQGNKIGNANLKWAFSEAAVLVFTRQCKSTKVFAEIAKAHVKSKSHFRVGT